MNRFHLLTTIATSGTLASTNIYTFWKFHEQERINEQIRKQLESKLVKPPKNGTISDFGRWYDKEVFPYTNEQIIDHFMKETKRVRIEQPTVKIEIDNIDENVFSSNWEKREASEYNLLVNSDAEILGYSINFSTLTFFGSAFITFLIKII